MFALLGSVFSTQVWTWVSLPMLLQILSLHSFFIMKPFVFYARCLTLVIALSPLSALLFTLTISTLSSFLVPQGLSPVTTSSSLHPSISYILVTTTFVFFMFLANEMRSLMPYPTKTSTALFFFAPPFLSPSSCHIGVLSTRGLFFYPLDRCWGHLCYKLRCFIG